MGNILPRTKIPIIAHQITLEFSRKPIGINIIVQMLLQTAGRGSLYLNKNQYALTIRLEITPTITISTDGIGICIFPPSFEFG